MAASRDVDEIWIYRCNGSVCGAAWTGGCIDSLRRLVHRLPTAVLASTSCLGPCHRAPVLHLTWRVGGASGAIRLTGRMAAGAISDLRTWLRAGATSAPPVSVARHVLPPTPSRTEAQRN